MVFSDRFTVIGTTIIQIDSRYILKRNYRRALCTRRVYSTVGIYLLVVTTAPLYTGWFISSPQARLLPFSIRWRSCVQNQIFGILKCALRRPYCFKIIEIFRRYSILYFDECLVYTQTSVFQIRIPIFYCKLRRIEIAVRISSVWII